MQGMRARLARDSAPKLQRHQPAADAEQAHAEVERETRAALVYHAAREGGGDGHDDEGGGPDAGDVAAGEGQREGEETEENDGPVLAWDGAWHEDSDTRAIYVSCGCSLGCDASGGGGAGGDARRD